MAPASRLGLGAELVWRSLRAAAVDRRLVVYGLLSWVAFVGSVAWLGASIAGPGPLVGLAGLDGRPGTWVGLAEPAVAALAGAVLTTLCNVAGTDTAIRGLRGERPRIRGGLVRALGSPGRILAWGLLSSTVAPLVPAVEALDRSGRVGRTVFGRAPSTVTLLLLPVIAFERVRLGRLPGRSAGLFRKRWGLSVGATTGIDRALATVGLPLALVGAYAALADLGPLAADFLSALAVAGLLVLALLRQVALPVAKAALYVHATTGRPPREFTDLDLSRIARRAPPGRGRGR